MEGVLYPKELTLSLLLHHRYKFDTEFEREIKKEVFAIVRRGKEFGTPGYFFRASCYIALFFYLQYRWMQQTSYALAILYGVSMALIGLNVQHDANHGAASRKVWINNLLGLGADFIGGSKWLWMEKHWTHHAYTNHNQKDPDGLAAEPIVLFNDYPLGSPKRTAMHAYQGFYVVLVLAGYWLSSVFDIPQIWYLQDAGATNVGMKLDNNPWIASRAKYAVALRVLYHICNLIIPLYNDFSWTTVAHINLMGIAGSLALGLLFTLSHNFENADRDPTVEARKTGKPVCWFTAQVETSSTYGGMISGMLTGGLNFQVEHHLFPRMSSAWYPYIAPAVRKVCEKHGVKYAYYPWVWQNMISTLKYTHEVGNASHWKQNPFKGEL
jgi:acyl-lipid (7-3)-desaturase (Delta-4 desaturase)